MKQLEPKVVKIGDKEFYIKPFSAFDAANLSGEVSALIAPILTGLVPIIGAMEDVEHMDMEMAIRSLGGAFQNLDGDKLESLLKKLLINKKNIAVKYTDEDGEKVEDRLTYDMANELFCGELDSMYRLAYEVIALNYGSFFSKESNLFGNRNLIKIKKKKA